MYIILLFQLQSENNTGHANHSPHSDPTINKNAVINAINSYPCGFRLREFNYFLSHFQTSTYSSECCNLVSFEARAKTDNFVCD